MSRTQHKPDQFQEPDPARRDGAQPAGSTPAGSPPTGALVLVVSPSSERRATLASAMRQDNLSCAFAESPDAAMNLLRARIARSEPIPFEAVLVDLQTCTASALRFVRELGERNIASVLVCPTVSFDEAVEAMRAGASDIVTTGLAPPELGRRVRSAVNQQRAAKAIESQPAPGIAGVVPVAEGEEVDEPLPLHRPRTANPSAPKARRSRDCGPEPVETDASKLTSAFAQQIRGELDVETLLREVLEFILAHVGPTNAAVFLPGTSGDFSLGAYVNYTCPKDTAEVLLDHLANVAAPNLEHTAGVLRLTRPEDLREYVGECMQWLEESHMLAFTCRHEGECLAVFTLFRDAHSPFAPEVPELLQRLGEVFGEQLARVIRIHHRHLPRDKWGALGDPPSSEDADGGMAA